VSDAQPALRRGRDDDAAGFIRVVSDCWAEYPGCVTDIDGEAPELHRLASHCAARGGAVWTAEAEGSVVGMICTWPLADGAWELAKLYVAAAHRGSGVANDLCGIVERHARAHGAKRMQLWSDTRFERAHRFYEKHSYVRSGPIRALDDKSKSVEFGYAKPLAGVAVERLDAAGAASAELALSRILIACVDSGASVSFLPPLTIERASVFWHRVAGAVARGEKILVAAWLDGALVGTVQVDLAMPENQPHRGDVAKMLVHPEARRRGIGRLMLQRAEAEAAAAQRTLLVLDTRAGSDAEPLYRAAGWTEAGRIPFYALSADRAPHDTVLFFKMIG
jgi:GNAT superfamily N-acetyltransferase